MRPNLTFGGTAGRWLRKGVLILLLPAMAACQIVLNTNLDEQEANEMMARLMANGILASKETAKEGITLMVPKADFAQAVDLLQTYGLPRKKFVNSGDLFADDGLVASPVQEWARFTYAKSQELSQSISSIPGVVRADVHIAVSRQESPFQEQKLPTASVLIQMRGDMIGDDLIPKIKQLVSFSIPDISYDRVAVIVSPVASAPQSDQLVGMGGLIVHPDSVLAVRAIAIAASVGLVLSIALGGLLLWSRRKVKPAEPAE